MSDFYPEYSNGRFPLYFSQWSIAEEADGTIWVLTCSHEEKGCGELLQFDYHAKKLVGRASSPYPIRKFKRLADGRYVVIDSESDTIHVFKEFPFPVKRRGS